MRRGVTPRFRACNCQGPKKGTRPTLPQQPVGKAD